MNELKIKCSCGKEFISTKKMLIEHKYDNGLIEIYYLCPHCKTKHHVCWMNEEVKKLQKLIDKARAQGNTELCMALCDKKKNIMFILNHARR